MAARQTRLIAILCIVTIALLSALAMAWMIVFGGADTVGQQIADIANRQFGGPPSASLLTVFFVVALLTQLLVVPSGSLLLVAAGFVFGALSAAGLYAVAQMLTAWPVFALTCNAMQRERSTPWSSHIDNPAVRRVLRSIESVRHDSFIATITLRLTPVVPSAVACVLAAMLGLSLRGFLLGTLASCWIRPLFFASVGEGLRATGRLREQGAQFAFADLLPLLLLFAASLAILLIRMLPGGKQ